IPGSEPAVDYVRAALLAGKSVVTSNKAVIAHQGEKLRVIGTACVVTCSASATHFNSSPGALTVWTSKPWLFNHVNWPLKKAYSELGTVV
ncbi:MAG: hypothetical protein WCL39_14845, partial [Armatimonadota bacterium]